MASKPIYKNLTFQVLVAIVAGAAIGAVRPRWGVALKPLGDGFINLVKMVVAPIIFLTIVVGIASMGDLKKVGRVGGKAILYFELVTTVALAIGLLVANVLRPGDGVRSVGAPPPASTQSAISAPGAVPQSTIDPKIQEYAKEAQKHSISEFLLNVIPENVIGAFATGNLLQILFFSVLFGIAVTSLGMTHSGLIHGMERLIEVMFRIVAMIMKVGPLGALGAMAFTVGKYGVKSLLPLLKLVGCVYLTMVLFVVLVLGLIAWYYRFSLWRYLAFIREEIVLVLGTSSSETALPRMIEKLELMGCGRAIVGMVIPAGYSFNLDGTSIYLSMSVLFIAQAFGVHLGFWQQLEIMGVLMLTSKGAAAVTGAGFVTLAATLSTTHDLPVEGLALLIGVDRFMSTARAITNLIGNGVATIVVSKMEREFDEHRYKAAIHGAPFVGAPAGGFSAEVSADVAREGID